MSDQEIIRLLNTAVQLAANERELRLLLLDPASALRASKFRRDMVTGAGNSIRSARDTILDTIAVLEDGGSK